MKLYEAFLREPNENSPTLTAVAPANAWHQDVVLRHVVVLKIAEGLALPIRYNTPALILNTDSMNILLGYFDPADKTQHTKKTIADGDMFLTCGSTRGLRTSEDGGIEIVNMYRKDTGEIIINPIVSYGRDNALNVTLESLMIDMLGANAGGNIAWTQDKELGFNTFIENYKGSNKDVGPRVHHKIEGGPDGLTVQYIWDVTPGPVGGALPNLIDTALANSIKIAMSGTKPFSFTHNLGPAAQLEISVDPAAGLSVKNLITQAEISIASSGEVSIKSAGGLGTITMSPAGAIDVKAKTTINIEANAGFQIKGKGQELLTQLSEFIQQYVMHTHATGVGPSGPPITAGETITGPKLKIKVMAG